MSALKIGWAETDITPEQPAYLLGQFYARVSEGTRDPLTATALVLQSEEDHVLFVSCDLGVISHELRDKVREFVAKSEPNIDPSKVVLNATHTHTGAEVRPPSMFSGMTSEAGVELEVMDVEAYLVFAADRIAQAVCQAWQNRVVGGISYGQGYAVIGRNRRWVDVDGQSIIYRLNTDAVDRFRHIEGYEDHSVNLVGTYDAQNQLTGLLVNLACPSQEEEHGLQFSADWWYETRQELRRRFGSELFILPQCSAAGDLTSHLLYDKPSHERMLRLKGRTAREEIAQRVVHAVADVLPFMWKDIVSSVCLRHRVETLALKLNRISEDAVQSAKKDAAEWRMKYEEEKQRLADQPELRKEPMWYKKVSFAFRRMGWYENVIRRYERQQTQATWPVEVHVLRIGEMAFATVPFELYLDYGLQIKVRSKAVQTFLVQLTGHGTYVPSPRSVQGGGYGSVPASNVIGPEGGEQLVEHAVSVMKALWGMGYE